MTAPPVPSSPRLADRLLLLALDPADGRIHGGRSLDVSLRAALLAELGLRGVVTSDGRAPQLGPLSGQLAGQTRGELAASPSAATGDHVLDA
nr:GPP34 family phosphoprotein [Actinomycetota bacterium]